MAETTDEALLTAWVAGDARSGEVLFDRHFSSLFRFFASKVPTDAADLTQETLLACVEGATAGTEVRRFRAYMFGVARRRLALHFRRRGRAGVDFATQSVADLAPGPSTLLSTHERRGLLQHALRGLTLDQQIAVELYYWEGLRTAEIAEILDVAEGTVRSRLERARQELRATLAPTVPRVAERAADAASEPLREALVALAAYLAGSGSD